MLCKNFRVRNFHTSFCIQKLFYNEKKQTTVESFFSAPIFLNIVTINETPKIANKCTILLVKNIENIFYNTSTTILI